MQDRLSATVNNYCGAQVVRFIYTQDCRECSDRETTNAWSGTVWLLNSHRGFYSVEQQDLYAGLLFEQIHSRLCWNLRPDAKHFVVPQQSTFCPFTIRHNPQMEDPSSHGECHRDLFCQVSGCFSRCQDGKAISQSNQNL